jgi:hypothetical protein
VVLGLRLGGLMRRRGRAPVAVFVVAAAIAAGAGLLGFIAGDDPVEPVCARPDDLERYRGIRLTAEAMDAFRQAEREAGRRIDVVHSYRSCWQQARACRQVCGSRQGCPGTCAPPGLSWHQRGAAVDITEAMLETPGVVDSLKGAGWCQAVPDSDPGHFSFGGCH